MDGRHEHQRAAHERAAGGVTEPIEGHVDQRLRGTLLG